MSGIFKFVQKSCRYSIWVKLMHKNKIFPNIYLTYIKNCTLFTEFSSMCQSIYTIYNSDSLLLSTVYFLKVCPGCISPCNVPVIKIGMYVKLIQWQQWMFIYIVLCLIQQPNIFSNFNFNIFNVFFPA